LSPPRKLIIVGAGGHGRVVLDAARLAGWHVAGFIDRDRAAGSEVNRCPVLGGDELLDARYGFADAWFVVALGDQRRRRALCERIRAAGGTLACVVHPAAILSEYASIGPGTVVLARAAINANARIGACCIVNTGAIVEHDCDLADGVQIGPGATLAAGVIVESDGSVGAGAVVIPNVRLGAGSILGAGAAAIADLEAGAVAVGVPARVVRRG
jgi:sugar O-acyltransferase (sialic acid O-acetyltransferase NeuD family)